MPTRIPEGVLRRERVLPALDLFPGLKDRVPPNWILGQQRVGQLVDAQRVYRWLASGGVGWSGEQLRSLECLVERLVGRDPRLDCKLAEVWAAEDDRFDSLTTELLLADTFVAAGRTVEVEPDIGGRRPEYLVDERLLVEAKTYCPRSEEEPLDRLLFELCHRVDSGYHFELAVRGELVGNDVGPLIRQVAGAFGREVVQPKQVGTFRGRNVEIVLKAIAPIPDMSEGSSISSFPRAVADEALLRRTFLPWLAKQVKEANRQMRAYAGSKAVVVDISYCRVAVDMLELDASAVGRIREDLQRECPGTRCLLATRFQGQQFGELRFIPHSPLDLL